MFKKILLTVSVLFAIGLMVRNTEAEQGGLTAGSDSRFWMYITTQAGTIVPKGVIYSVTLSSGVENTNPYVQFFSTTGNGVNYNMALVGNFADANKMSVQNVFLSSPVVNASNIAASPMVQRYEFGGGKGLRSGTTIQFYKSAAGFGGANGMLVEYGF